MRATPEQITNALWPSYPEVVWSCLHPDTPLMCDDHLDAGLLCEACLIEHVMLAHADAADNVPEICTLCGEGIVNEARANALAVAAMPGGMTLMRTAHDINCLLTPTSAVMVKGPDADRDALYQGPIRLWGHAWLCDSCRAATPADTLIAV